VTFRYKDYRHDAQQKTMIPAAIRKRAKAAGFLTPSDVTPGGQPASPFTWRTTDGSSTPNR
jgi:hypothetical protein